MGAIALAAGEGELIMLVRNKVCNEGTMRNKGASLPSASGRTASKISSDRAEQERKVLA
jgi:hypothetical protein